MYSFANNHPELMEGDISIIIATVLGALFVFICKKSIDFIIKKNLDIKIFILCCATIPFIALTVWIVILLYMFNHRIVIN